MIVADVPFAAIDFESAGIQRGGTDVPVQIGVALMRCLEVSELFSSFLFTKQPITWAAQKVHGICASDLAGAPPLLELWPEIRRLLENRWIVAHGSATERRFLRAFPFHGFGPWIDTLKLSRVRSDGSATWEGQGILRQVAGRQPCSENAGSLL